MLFGDNLLDFIDFKKFIVKECEKFVKKYVKDFGKKYIIFLNLMYGSWELIFYYN